MIVYNGGYIPKCENPSMKIVDNVSLQVLQVKLKDGLVSAVRELFVDDGQLITGSAVATVYKNRMLIGSIFDSLVYCDVNVPL